ncbi:MAG: sigma factor-like helix-turn-helix DNA-binding protein [Deinococcales bacterium]
MALDTLSYSLKVARMYYYQELSTQEIADSLGLSRSKVSRLLSYAKSQGLVEIRILEPTYRSQ